MRYNTFEGVLLMAGWALVTVGILLAVGSTPRLDAPPEFSTREAVIGNIDPSGDRITRSNGVRIEMHFSDRQTPDRFNAFVSREAAEKFEVGQHVTVVYMNGDFVGVKIKETK